jgi:hypothetical protein
MIAAILRMLILSCVLACRQEVPGILICSEDDVDDVRYLNLDTIEEIRYVNFFPYNLYDE